MFRTPTKHNPLHSSYLFCVNKDSYKEYIDKSKPRHYTDKRHPLDRGLSLLQGLYMDGYHNTDPSHPLLSNHYYQGEVFSAGYKQKLSDEQLIK